MHSFDSLSCTNAEGGGRDWGVEGGEMFLCLGELVSSAAIFPLVRVYDEQRVVWDREELQCLYSPRN